MFEEKENKKEADVGFDSREFIEKFCIESKMSSFLVEDYTNFICKYPKRTRAFLMKSLMDIRSKSD